MAKTKDNRQGASTRQRLVKVAEKLFAADGIDAVSVRAINAAAGLGPASVHYHFGSKADLLQAVLEDLGGAVREQINVAIAEIEQADEPASALELFAAMTDPYLKLLEERPLRGIRWVKIVANAANSDPDAVGPPDQVRALRTQIRRSFPDVDHDRLERRWMIAMNGYLQTLSHVDRWAAVGPGKDPGPLREFHADLVAHTAGGFSAANAREVVVR